MLVLRRQEELDGPLQLNIVSKHIFIAISERSGAAEQESATFARFRYEALGLSPHGNRIA